MSRETAAQTGERPFAYRLSGRLASGGFNEFVKLRLYPKMLSVVEGILCKLHDVNSCDVEFMLENIKLCLLFLKFLNNASLDIAQVVEILPNGR